MPRRVACVRFVLRWAREQGSLTLFGTRRDIEVVFGQVPNFMEIPRSVSKAKIARQMWRGANMCCNNFLKCHGGGDFRSGVHRQFQLLFASMSRDQQKNILQKGKCAGSD